MSLHQHRHLQRSDRKPSYSTHTERERDKSAGTQRERESAHAYSLVPAGDHGAHGQPHALVGIHRVGQQLGRRRHRDTLLIPKLIQPALAAQVALPEGAVSGAAGHRAKQVRIDLDHLLHVLRRCGSQRHTERERERGARIYTDTHPRIQAHVAQSVPTRACMHLYMCEFRGPVPLVTCGGVPVRRLFLSLSLIKVISLGACVCAPI
jgi:hypothetical protein